VIFEKVVFVHMVAAGKMHLSLVKSKWAPHVTVLRTKTIMDGVDVYFCGVKYFNKYFFFRKYITLI
jgi:hypothetical protein